MQIFRKIFVRIFSIQSTAYQNGLFAASRATYHSDIESVEMSVDVFESDATDPNLPPLIIMHGLFGSKNNWRRISKGLEKRIKRKIYNVDARNHGDSPHVDAHSSAHMSADIGFLIQQENLQRVSVMGHSMGGRAMMYFALKYPESVEKAIIVDISPISIPKNLDIMEDVFVAMKNIKVPPDLPMVKGRVIVESQMKKVVRDQDAVDFLMLNLKKLDTGEFVWRHNVAALHASLLQFRAAQHLPEMAHYNGPMLFIAARKSSFLSESEWPRIKKIFPNADLKWINSGHLVHFEQPAKLMDMVTEFLN